MGAARGYSLDAADTTDDGKFRVRFAHKGTLRLPDITSHTIALRRKASELGGDYDGWETPVCKHRAKEGAIHPWLDSGQAVEGVVDGEDALIRVVPGQPTQIDWQRGARRGNQDL